MVTVYFTTITSGECKNRGKAMIRTLSISNGAATVLKRRPRRFSIGNKTNFVDKLFVKATPTIVGEAFIFYL